MAVAAAIMPVIAVATEAARTGQIGSGARVGFWSGAVSGVMTFVALASVGYLVVSVPGFPGVEVPRKCGPDTHSNRIGGIQHWRLSRGWSEPLGCNWRSILQCGRSLRRGIGAGASK